MNINEINKSVFIENGYTEQYSFLSTDKNLGKNIILLGLGGSHAYGTCNEDSDLDIRGIAVNSKENILLSKDFCQVVNVETDTTIYSLDKMFELLSNCNPNTIEILGLRPDHYLYLSDIGKLILENKEIFLSRRCINTFAGYANQQLYRLQQKSLCALSKEEYNSHTAKVLNKMILRFKKLYNVDDSNIRAYVSESGDLMLNFNFNNIKAETVSSILNELNQTIRDYSEPSKRNKKAETHGKIAKHSMHLLRLYMMCIDILDKHEINTFREKEHDLLMSVRNGYYLDSDGKPTDEFFNIVKDYESRFEESAKTTSLSQNPDMDKINKLRASINERIVKGE